MSISRIGLIGYGNVGSHFANALSAQRNVQVTVYHRSPLDENNISPASIRFTTNLEELSDSELILLSVKDSAIEEVLSDLKKRIFGNPIVIHCAGSVPARIIESYFPSYGVLYPLQTFSRHKKLEYRNIPLFITASEEETMEVLREIAGYISPIIREIDDDQRMALHIAGVFSCNYTNALYAIGQRICSEHDIPFDYMIPLIRETAEKIEELPPEQAQTGPAVRGDLETVEKHEKFLSTFHPELEDLYRMLALTITQNKQK